MSFQYFINVFGSILNLVQTVHFLVAVMLVAGVQFLFKYFRTRKLRKILGFSSIRGPSSWFNEEIYMISLPHYKREKYGAQKQFLLKDEAELQHELFNLLAITKAKLVPFSECEHIFGCHELHIGGVTSNKNTATYVRNYVQGFRAVTSEYAKKSEPGLEDLHEDLLIRPKGDGFDVLNFGSLPFTKGRYDWAVLIKLTPDDLGEDKTVHLMFGYKFEGTRNAVKYFAAHYQDLYSRFQGKHYCVALLVDIRGSKCVCRQIVDCTSWAFVQCRSI